MRKLALSFALALAGCTGITQQQNNNSDSGNQQQTYQELDQAHADFTLTANDDSQMATASIHLTDATGAAVVMQQGQEVTVNNVALASGAAGTYGASVPLAATFQVVVDEPRHGLPSTTLTPPQDFTIGAGPFSLSGTTLTWSPTEANGTVTIHLEQQTPDGLAKADFTLTTDTGSKAFTEADLSQFVQGYMLQITITKAIVGPTLQGVASSTCSMSRVKSESVNPTS